MGKNNCRKGKVFERIWDEALVGYSSTMRPFWVDPVSGAFYQSSADFPVSNRRILSYLDRLFSRCKLENIRIPKILRKLVRQRIIDTDFEVYTRSQQRDEYVAIVRSILGNIVPYRWIIESFRGKKGKSAASSLNGAFLL